MSSGWDPGDITQAVKLVHKIIKSVSSVGGARDDFQQLQSELRGLLRALNEISDLTKQPGQLPEIVALKFAACLCEDTLKNFFGNIAPFDESLRGDSQLSKLKAAPKMVRWELLVKKNIPEFRSYLVAHVGSLNLRLNTALLRLGSKSLVNQVQNQAILKQSVEDSYSKLDTQANDIFTKIKAITQEDTIPKLNSLLDLASSVWLTQNAMVQLFEKAVDALPSPNLRYTWAQAPLKFEDALGRVIPVPSEYDWDKLEAIIQAQFKTGPGQAKVRSGEYELFTGMTSLIPLKSQNFHPMPGMVITMTFIVGQYIGSERCPRVGCRSLSFTQAFTTQTEVKICLECQTWFRKSKCVLAKPMKPVPQESRLCNVKEFIHREYSETAAAYEDRMSYKNISIYVTELPPTPKVFRDKYHRKSSPSKSTHKVMPPIKPAASNKSNLPTFGVTQNTDFTWSHRPQTNQMTALPKIHINPRPCTLGFETTLTTLEPPGSIQVVQFIDRHEITHEAIDTANLDQDFKDELAAIEQLVRVYSEGERITVLYALLEQTTLEQIEFFMKTLCEMRTPSYFHSAGCSGGHLNNRASCYRNRAR